MEEDPSAVVALGDSAYHRSKQKNVLGIKRPVPQRDDGVQQKVYFSEVFSVAFLAPESIG